jgi:GT2 family glycosyltransferase
MNRIVCIVVTYNRLELLKRCFQSLLEQSYKEFDIIIVNNGSTDGTTEWLNSIENITVISQSNLGGAGGFYAGMKYAAEEGYDYVWAMDDDVVPNEQALKKLMSAVSLVKEIGFLCSKVTNLHNNPTNIPSIDKRIGSDGRPIWIEKIEHTLVRVNIATFVSILVPIQNIYKVGLTLKDFFIWGDDTEYTLRLSKLSPSYLVGNSIVIHKRVEGSILSIISEPSSNPQRVKLYFFFFRNHFYLLKRRKYSCMTIVRGYIGYLCLIMKLCIKFKFYRALLVLNGFFASICFNPIIEYPEKNN